MLSARVDRRSLLKAATTALLSAGGGFVAVGLFKAMGPAAGEGPASPPVRYPVADLRVGQAATLTWGGRPVCVLHRSSADIAWLLGRPQPTQQPGAAPTSFRATPLRSLTPDYFVFEPVCTLDDRVVVRDDSGVFPTRGLVCPRCGTRYDLAGRVFSGPAPRSLTVPPYHFEGPALVVVGEDQIARLEDPRRSALIG